MGAWNEKELEEAHKTVPTNSFVDFFLATEFSEGLLLVGCPGDLAWRSGMEHLESIVA